MEKIRITGTIKTADSLAKRQSVLQAIFLCISCVAAYGFVYVCGQDMPIPNLIIGWFITVSVAVVGLVLWTISKKKEKRAWLTHQLIEHSFQVCDVNIKKGKANVVLRSGDNVVRLNNLSVFYGGTPRVNVCKNRLFLKRKDLEW